MQDQTVDFVHMADGTREEYQLLRTIAETNPVPVAENILGLLTDFVPKHARQYARLAELIADALRQYAEEVKEGSFPSEKESFEMDEGILEGIDEVLERALYQP